MHVIATAGHVDHGKSTLVRLLTGMEPDRWEQERARGLTIDLGFAWTTLRTGDEVAFVDVPGHERFVANMLAGVGPVPAVLFTVAADEGWMPQSAEHLAALNALGVRHGLLAVTRCDLADPGPATRQALGRLAGTGLAAVESVAVSGRTGEGVDQLRGALDRLVAGLPPADTRADVRLWVDRSFSVRGAGTVVTGTLAGGTLRPGDELELASTGVRVRVRGLQTLGRDAPAVPAVARVAVNLRGVERSSVARGDALLTPRRWLATEEIDVALRPGGTVPAVDAPGEAVSPRAEPPARLVLHVGSAAVAVRVRPLAPGIARLRLARPLPLRVGDRVLLRDPGRHRVVAGADVLDVRPPPLRRSGEGRRRGRELSALADAAPQALAEAVLRRLRFATSAELRARGLPPTGEAVPGGGYVVHPAVWRVLVGELRALVERWRAEHPLDPGVPVDVVRQRLALPTIAAVERLADAASLPVVGGRVGPAGPTAPLPGRVETAVRALAVDLSAEPFAAPDAARLATLRLGGRELAAAVRAGRLQKIGDGVVLLPGAEIRAARVLAGLPQPFTLSQARRVLGTTRRVAVPLLELMDRQGITERLPDSTRRLRPPGTRGT